MKSLNSKVNPPVEMESEGITLNSGLDLVSSNLMVDKGALRDCENFEVVDRLGYQTVSGFDRFDGKLTPDQVRFKVFRIDPDTLVTLPSVGFQFKLATGPQTLFGIIVEVVSIPTDGDYVVYAEYSSDNVVSAGDNLETVVTGSSIPFDADNDAEDYVGSSLQPTGETADQTFAKFQAWNAVLRNRVTPLPEQPIGLHWFRDRLYAVTNLQRLAFTSGGTTEVVPNSIIRDTATGATFCYRVLDVELLSGDWSLGTANGILLVQSIEFFDGVGETINTNIPTSGDFDLLENVPDVVNWIDPTNEIQTNVLTARALVSTDPAPKYAGLWRNKLATEPDGGWESIETGWKIDYENGFSFADELRQIERAIDNNFQFGTDDQEGLSAAWFNGNELSPENTQTLSNEFGWSDGTNFASGFGNIEDEDGDYLYGDIDFGIRASDGLVERISGSSDSVRARLAPVPLIDRPDAGTSPAGSSSARAPMTFLGLGPILDLIPRDAQVAGIEIEMKAKVAFGVRGEIPEADFASLNDAEQGTVNTLNNLFQCSVEFGEYDPGAGKFNTRGQKRSVPLALPTNRTSYTWTSSGPSMSFYSVAGKWIDPSNITLTIGSPTELFGLTDVSRGVIERREFGLVLYGENLVNSTPLTTTDFNFPTSPLGMVGATRLGIDSLVIRIHYDEPSARYYVREGSTNKILTFDLVNNTVLKGQLRDRTAEGNLQVVNIQSVNSGADFKNVILGGDEIYLDDLFTRKVADVKGTAGEVAMALNGLPALDDIVEQASRYQFITANFFAREDWDGFYGVSGAGKAFSFAAFDADNDGDEEQYLQFITTNTIVPDEDRPRHIEVFQNHLALGYKDGTVRLSVPGEPELFDGIAGAVEIGVGDRVTGLLSMRGKALGIFCEKKIITLLGDDADNFTLETLAPKTGAIEYTVVDMGIPLYCDNRGISTLEQSQKYGNFVGIRMSQKVSPWILPRMTRAEDLFSLAKGAGVVCAVPVRAKNQYRVFFRDGRVLILTMNGDGSLAYTYALYYLNEERDEFIVPIAHSSEVDGDGVERIHLAHFSPRSTINAATSRRVWEFERGYGFDGSWYDAFFDTAFSYNDPFRESTVRKIRADGLTRGYGPYTITVAKDYDEDSYSVTDVPLSLPRNPADSVADDPKPATTMANVAKEGRCLSYRIKRDESQKTLVPPTVYQVLLVQYQVGGKRDA